MKCVVLGTAGYHPNDRRQTTCVMLPELGVLFDAGTAVYRVRHYLVTDHLDIFLSHAHLDHVIGLTYLLDGVTDRTSALRVHGASEKLDAVREHLFAAAMFPVDPPFAWSPFTGPVVLGEDVTVDACPLRHPGGSLGYRLQMPARSLAYITDTTADPDADYVTFVQGVDLLIHECHFNDGQESLAELTGHSCASQVAQVARAAQVQQLVLIHHNPSIDAQELDLEAIRRIFPATELAEDNATFEF